MCDVKANYEIKWLKRQASNEQLKLSNVEFQTA